MPAVLAMEALAEVHAGGALQVRVDHHYACPPQLSSSCRTDLHASRINDALDWKQ
jgi:hypothetical protein